ncbi:MAG: phospholipid carrier-dependent glycosyltransferase [bacterium]|nr:phospholipid carrier-dependent glycosyltransferase [bacterium]
MSKSFLFLITLYLATRFFNLLALPIFNDESIYLHWGQIMTGVPNNAFYSLFDGKPPFILWLFGFFQNLPIDPLVAGRLVSILFGLGTLIGIIQLARLIKFSQKAQILVSLLYIFNPLMLFFDRLAILDSPISAIFIWVLYCSLSLGRSDLSTGRTSLKVIALGLLLALGLWIKGSANLFLFLPFIIPCLTLLFDKNSKKAGKEFLFYSFSFLLAQLLFIPIRLQPLFQTYSKRESDFLLFPLPTSFLSLLNSLPSVALAKGGHLSLLSLTLIIYVTPLVLLFAVFGFQKLYKKEPKTALLLALWLFLPLAFEISFAKYFLSRYFLFSIIPIFFFTALSLDSLKKFQKPALLLTFILPLALVLALAISPLKTIQTISFNQILKSDMPQYVSGWPSGYGVKETADWLLNKSKTSPILVITRGDSGNPEDGMFVYLANKPNIILAQTSQKLTSKDLEPFKNLPIYFVSRGEQYLDMKNQLVEQKIFPKPEGTEFVGIYQIKNVDSGKQ